MDTCSTDERHSRRQWQLDFIYTSVLGIVGVLSLPPVVMKVIPQKALLKYSLSTIVTLSLLQAVVVVCICAVLGTTLAKRIGFETILDKILSTKRSLWAILRSRFAYGVPIGISGAIIAYLIAPGFIAYLNSFPQASRVFVGFYEEIVIRWGIMTLIVWTLWRLNQKGAGVPKNSLIWSGIVLSQILFAGGHFVSLMRLGITNPVWPIATIFIVTLPWGWLFWKRGIESAIVAHVSFHVSVILLVDVNL